MQTPQPINRAALAAISASALIDAKLGYRSGAIVREALQAAAERYDGLAAEMSGYASQAQARPNALVTPAGARHMARQFREQAADARRLMDAWDDDGPSEASRAA